MSAILLPRPHQCWMPVVSNPTPSANLFAPEGAVQAKDGFRSQVSGFGQDQNLYMRTSGTFELLKHSGGCFNLRSARGLFAVQPRSADERTVQRA